MKDKTLNTLVDFIILTFVFVILIQLIALIFGCVQVNISKYTTIGIMVILFLISANKNKLFNKN